jgi:hypothetical protein
MKIPKEFVHEVKIYVIFVFVIEFDVIYQQLMPEVFLNVDQIDE